MIDVKEAVRKAYDYMKEVYPESLRELRLEEVDRDDLTDNWLITMGYTEDVPISRARNAIQQVLRADQLQPVTRSYKILTIDKETGDVKKMKIRIV